MIIIRLDEFTIFVDGNFYEKCHFNKTEMRKLCCDYSERYCFQCPAKELCGRKEAFVYRQMVEILDI